MNTKYLEQRLTKKIKPQGFLRGRLAISISFAIIALASSKGFAQVSYTGAGGLVDSDFVDSQFSELIGQSVLGVYDNVAQNADFEINYSAGDTPFFVLAGYVQATLDDTAETLSSSDNKVSLMQGDVNGNVYAGLVHATRIQGDIDCTIQSSGCTSINEDDDFSNKSLSASKNKITTVGEQAIAVDGDMYAGYAGITINAGNFTSTADIDAQIAAYNSILSAAENGVMIEGDSHTFKDITAGYTGITFNFGNSTAGDTVDTANADARATVDVDADAQFSTLSATDNSVAIAGNGHTFNNITAGYTSITGNFGDLAGGDAGATLPNAFETSTTVTNSATALESQLSATDNSVVIEGDGHTVASITAGYAGITFNFGDISTGEAVTNVGKATAEIYAASDASESVLSATGNSVTITGDSHRFENITAGHAGITLNFGNITAGGAGAGNTTDEVAADASALVYAYESILSATGNNLSITGVNNTVNNLTAGYAALNINVGDIKGGRTNQDGDEGVGSGELNIEVYDTKLSANDNTVTLSGGSTVNGNIHAGYIDFNIDHGTVKGGGPDDTAEDGSLSVLLDNTSATAINNEITISGEHLFTNPDASIYGGYLNYSATSEYKPEVYDVFTGNTLNYANKTPVTIGEVANFQNFNFTLNPDLANTGTALITAKNIVLGSNASNMSDGSALASDIRVVAIHSGDLLSTGSKFILMQADPGNLAGLGQGYLSRGVAEQGISLLYDVETRIDQENDQVIAEIISVDGAGPSINPRVKALLEGRLSGLMLLTRGADELSNTLFTGINEQNNKDGLKPFVIAGGNHSRYESGSHIKSNGALITAGLSFQNEQLTSAVFFESGRDSYKSHNDFDNASTVKGKGHNRFNGIGGFVHYDFGNRWYADGMLRGGRLHTNFDTNDLRNASTGERASYNIRTTYLGASVTGGYVLPLNEQNDVDLSAKYLWTSAKGKNEAVAGDPIHFKNMNSQRLRLNAENHYKMTPEVTLVAGLGYEYEFDGKAKGTTYERFDIDEPSVKGGTGIATVGMRYVPSANNSFSMDVKGSGYFGKREGASLTMKLGYEF